MRSEKEKTKKSAHFRINTSCLSRIGAMLLKVELLFVCLLLLLLFLGGGGREDGIVEGGRITSFRGGH